MIYRQHLIEIYVNGEKLELENQKSLNLRLNNVLVDPTKISNTQADYSFSFDIPSTPKNDRIFNYANELSKPNKFHTRWNAEVYADGQVIFNGSMTINSYKEKKYNVNLVSVKTYSLDDIFGDSTLTDIPWYIPFEGASSINSYNQNEKSKVTFPLVAYGVFQKDPEFSDDVANDYTSKFDIDKYNRWWIESFYPSLNMMETIRKAFQWKGYNVGGDAFNDQNLSEIFMSCNLSSEQMPDYNLGNPRLGKINLRTTYTTSGNGYEQELSFPYMHTAVRGFGGHYENTEGWNYDAVRIYDLMSSGVNLSNDTYMYDNNEKCIVIPADGFYKINMSVTSTLNTTGNITASQWIIEGGTTLGEVIEQNLTMPVGFNEVTPIEIHLVRNYDDNCELIKGKNNKRYLNGNPTQTTYRNGNSTVSNISEWITCFPHEDPYASTLPTLQNDLTIRKTSRQTASGNFGGSRSDSTSSSSSSSSSDTDTGRGSFGGVRRGVSSGGRSSWTGTTGSSTRGYNSYNYGYSYKDGQIMAYDQAVSDNFICGFSSFMGGTGAVMKNGYSWSKNVSTENNAFYKESGYNLRYRETGDTSDRVSATTFNSNTYPDAPEYSFSCTSNRMTGRLCCMVWLNKNDILELFALQRAYHTTAGTYVNYSTTNDVTLSIEAASPNSYAFLKSQGYGYNSPSQFDYDLKVTNFLNNETNVSSFIQGLSDAFNLEIIQDGKNIWINNNKSNKKYNSYAVDIDDRVNGANVESSIINYPKSMAVKYKIDTDEWGFEQSVRDVDPALLNQDDWKDYGEYGYSEIVLNDDSYITTTNEKSINFSYTWYDNFNWYEVDKDDNQSGTTMTLRIPVISNFTYMIDGYDYDESMKHDGYSLTQRFWYRPKATEAFVWTDSTPSERINVYVTENSNGVMNLSYKTSENSLLRYFNTKAYLSSNYVEVDVYLSPKEYNELKGGAMVRFDKNLFYVAEITGYDPTGYNPTTLKLMTKVI